MKREDFFYYLKFDFKELLLRLIPVWEDVTVREPFYLFRENCYPSSNVFFPVYSDPLDTSFPCQCNHACSNHGDCCDDYITVCDVSNAV